MKKAMLFLTDPNRNKVLKVRTMRLMKRTDLEAELILVKLKKFSKQKINLTKQLKEQGLKRSIKNRRES